MCLKIKDLRPTFQPFATTLVSEVTKDDQGKAKGSYSKSLDEAKPKYQRVRGDTVQDNTLFSTHLSSKCAYTMFNIIYKNIPTDCSVTDIKCMINKKLYLETQRMHSHEITCLCTLVPAGEMPTNIMLVYCTQ